jgi:peptide/nickel transport system substrate-binding protein
MIDDRTDTRRAIPGLSRRSLLGSAAAALPMGRALLGARSVVAAQADGSTLVVALSASPDDLDPHGANDYRSALTVRGAFEQLIGLVGDSSDEYEGLIAESWSANEDQSVWTFKIRQGVTFHDGSPVDAEAVRLSFER